MGSDAARARPEEPDDMREADIANGENVDSLDDEPDDHRTGNDQARRNREVDPPA